MTAANLQGVAERVMRRAQRQGFVVASEVREELTAAQLPDSLWKDTLALARPALRYQGGRYYYTAPLSARVRQEQSQQRSIARAIRQIVRARRRSAQSPERREQDRIDFIEPIRVVAADGSAFTLLSRDLSPTGIRLIGTRRLLGQKLRLHLPAPDGNGTREFLVRILWTCPVGDDLVENGGVFLEIQPATV